MLCGFGRGINNGRRTTVNIWLDDLRPAPEGFIHVHNMDEVVRLLKDTSDPVWVMSFDHDLGEGATGYDVIKFIADQFLDRYPREVRAHSANPVGRGAILQFDACVRRELLQRPDGEAR